MLRSRTLPMLLGSALAGMLMPEASALSQPASKAAPALRVGTTGDYKGVCPGTTHAPPMARTVKGNAITWPGFQGLPSGGSRIFVQSTGPVAQRLERRPGVLIVHLGAAKLAHNNNARPLLTRFFNTPVERAAIRVRRGQATLVLQMRADATPVLSTEVQDGTGYHFLYVDFPAGKYLTAPPIPKIIASGTPGETARPTHLEGNVEASGDATATDGAIEAKGEVKASGSVGF